ncbi:MAG TPA: phosphoribosylglycinamide formyltransferase [Chitinophagaceae bacterium]|nr:phosphoribosylglycinamide formyltransferase [Chitinophagaceae bacterium]
MRRNESFIHILQPGTKNILIKNQLAIFMQHDNIKRIAIFASGTGSNAKKIIERFATSQNIRVSLVVCNKPGAGVLKIAEENNIATLLLDREKFFRGDGYVQELKDNKIDFIVLAGFLWKIPLRLIEAYPGAIVNIHPALLPKYGGKGMYGNIVHEAVIASGDKQSGITIHYVDELYDHGKHILQAACPVFADDTAETLAQRIHALEHKHYPEVIEDLISKNF